MGSLAVWMNGELVGHWRNASIEQQTFQYADAWLMSAASRPLSLSLPFLPGNAEHRSRAVHAYFDNLLPDSQPIRARIASRYRTQSQEAFALLREIGADCVGAVQLLPDGEHPTELYSIKGGRLTDTDIEQPVTI